jgi:hypothetical protein
MKTKIIIAILAIANIFVTAVKAEDLAASQKAAQAQLDAAIAKGDAQAAETWANTVLKVSLSRQVDVGTNIVQPIGDFIAAWKPQLDSAPLIVKAMAATGAGLEIERRGLPAETATLVNKFLLSNDGQEVMKAVPQLIRIFTAAERANVLSLQAEDGENADKFARANGVQKFRDLPYDKQREFRKAVEAEILANMLK